jgi:hypothetical protein
MAAPRPERFNRKAASMKSKQNNIEKKPPTRYEYLKRAFSTAALAAFEHYYQEREDYERAADEYHMDVIDAAIDAMCTWLMGLSDKKSRDMKIANLSKTVHRTVELTIYNDPRRDQLFREEHGLPPKGEHCN